MNIIIVGNTNTTLSSWFENLSTTNNELTTYVIPSVEFAELLLDHVPRCAAIIFTEELSKAELDNAVYRLQENINTPSSLRIASYLSSGIVKIRNGQGWTVRDCSSDINELGVILGLYSSNILVSLNRPDNKLIFREIRTSADFNYNNKTFEGKNKLTPRQKEVLHLVNLGMSNKEIARDLSLTEGTVKVHCKAIFRVLGVSNRTQAAVMVSR